jgi:hypothetical protein
MIAKRLAAVALALAMIAGAWFVRDRVIDDGPGGADEPENSGIIVCVSELADMCRLVVGDRYDVVASSATATLDQLALEAAEPVLWLTFDGFPQMMNVRRGAARLDLFDYVSTELATSRLGVVVRPDKAAELVDACGDPIDLGCVAEQTQLQTAVSSVDSGLGLLALSAAFATRTDEVISFDDLDLQSWARRFRKATENTPLSGGTAVQTIQTRTSVAVAFGAGAELSTNRRDDFELLYADPVARARVVLMKPAGFSVPADLLDELGDALVARGWDDDRSLSDPGALPSPETMLGIREFWSELS